MTAYPPYHRLKSYCEGLELSKQRTSQRSNRSLLAVACAPAASAAVWPELAPPVLAHVVDDAELVVVERTSSWLLHHTSVVVAVGDRLAYRNHQEVPS